MLHPVVEQVTAALEQRSARRRERYVQRLAIAAERDPHKAMGCSNLAHAMAAQPVELVRRAALVEGPVGSRHHAAGGLHDQRKGQHPAAADAAKEILLAGSHPGRLGIRPTNGKERGRSR